MRAVSYSKYGSTDQLQLTDIATPKLEEDKILVKNYASSINIADTYLLTGKPFFARLASGGIFKPRTKVLGSDFAGEIVAVGENVTRFKVGDRVFGDNSAHNLSAFADHILVSPDCAAKVPDNISYEQAASLPLVGITALQAIQNFGGISPGASVLINGASGGVGVYQVQLAKYYGAKVTAVCRSAYHQQVKTLGADICIDYQECDICSLNEQYDVIFDIAAYRPAKDYGAILREQGKYIIVGGSIKRIFQAAMTSSLGMGANAKSISVLSAIATAEDLTFLSDRLASQELQPVIDSVLPITDIKSAFSNFMSNNKFGKIVVKIG